MRTVFLFIAALLLAGTGNVFLDGCKGRGRDLPFRALPDSQVWTPGKDEPAYFVVTGQNWQKYLAALPAGADLAKSIYVVASWGVKPNPGYRLSFIALRQIGSLVQVGLDMEEPEPGQFYTQVLVHPVAVAEIARVSLSQTGSLTFQFVNQRGTPQARVKVEP